MLRFDYSEQADGSFHVTVVSENGNSHSLAGRLVLSCEEWKDLWSSLHNTFGDRFKYFRFENKRKEDHANQ